MEMERNFRRHSRRVADPRRHLMACPLDIESGPFLRNGPTAVDE
jgi:hypothetical protein